MDRNTAHSHDHGASWSVRVVGLPITSYSRDIVQRLATRARLDFVHITSVRRTVEDQARTFFKKHVIEQKPANYKRQEVAQIIERARALHARGTSDHAIQTYIIRAIELLHGGPDAVSRHLSRNSLLEVFDIAHYSAPTKGSARQNYMTDAQAKAFLEGCRDLIPFPINRVGHSAELGLKLPYYEFVDEKCFHLEIPQPFDSLEVGSATKLA